MFTLNLKLSSGTPEAYFFKWTEKGGGFDLPLLSDRFKMIQTSVLTESKSSDTTQLILSQVFGRDFLKNINMVANYNAAFISRFTTKEQQTKGKTELHQLGKKSPKNRVQTFVPGHTAHV